MQRREKLLHTDRRAARPGAPPRPGTSARRTRLVTKACKTKEEQRRRRTMRGRGRWRRTIRKMKTSAISPQSRGNKTKNTNDGRHQEHQEHQEHVLPSAPARTPIMTTPRTSRTRALAEWHPSSARPRTPTLTTPRNLKNTCSPSAPAKGAENGALADAVPECPWTVMLLHNPLPLAGVSIVMEGFNQGKKGVASK